MLLQSLWTVNDWQKGNIQASRQDGAAGEAKNQKGGPHFKNTVLDVCSNRWAKREMGGTDFKWRGPGTTAPPLATALVISSGFYCPDLGSGLPLLRAVMCQENSQPRWRLGSCRLRFKIEIRTAEYLRVRVTGFGRLRCWLYRSVAEALLVIVLLSFALVHLLWISSQSFTTN